VQEIPQRRPQAQGQPADTLATLAGSLAEGGSRPAVLAFRRGGLITWSYAELAERVEAGARALAKAGLGKGDVVALFAENQPEWIATCLAALRLSAVLAPIDTQPSPQTLEHILADSGAKLIAVTATTAARLDGIRGAPAQIRIDDEALWQGAGDETAPATITAHPDETAILFYTSGTTGPPKGVPLSHTNLVFQLEALIQARIVSATDRVLMPLPMHHVFPLVIGILAPLSLKLPIILPRGMTGSHIATALREGEATVVIGVPRLYSALIEGLQARAAAQGRVVGSLFRGLLGACTWIRRSTGLQPGRLLAPLRRRVGPRLRLLVSGGAALDSELALSLEGLGWRVATGYGLTETSPMLAWNLPGRGKLDSAGRPIPGIEIRIDASAAGEAQRPPDEAAGQRYGEILARGPGVFGGYLNLPDKTQASLSDDGWFRTGDLGFLDGDGYLHIVGRANTMLVTEGGKNVAPETVEEAYLAAPEIREIAVLQKDRRLVALIVPEPRHAGEGEAMRQAIDRAVRERSSTLPSYQRISGYAITGEAIPRTRIGKPQRHLLADRYERAKQSPSAADAVAAEPIDVAQMSAEDQDLLRDPAARKVWQWLAERYGHRRLTPDSSPELDLGIDSVEWLAVTLEIGQRTGIDLSEEAIARVGTVRDLLREVAEAAEAGETFDASLLDAPETYLSDAQKDWLQPVTGGQYALASALHRANRWMMRALYRLHVEGTERLPPGQMLIAPTHGSLLDPFAIAAALERDRLATTFWIGDVEMAFGNPLTRTGSRIAQAVPIDTEKGFLSGLALAAAVLKRGHSLIWFPEGRRAREDGVQSLMPGIGILLERFPVPVVPVAIHGAHQAYPPGRILPRPGRISVVFGEPLDPAALKGAAKGEAAASAITAALQERLIELYDRSRP
jgi:long-chain acyl-CoA synthetase